MDASVEIGSTDPGFSPIQVLQCHKIFRGQTGKPYYFFIGHALDSELSGQSQLFLVLPLFEASVDVRIDQALVVLAHVVGVALILIMCVAFDHVNCLLEFRFFQLAQEGFLISSFGIRQKV